MLSAHLDRTSRQYIDKSRTRLHSKTLLSTDLINPLPDLERISPKLLDQSSLQ